MDVGDWLKSLGLGRYDTAFRDSSIDVDVLPDLTDGDLEKIGVTLEIANVCSRRSPRSGRRTAQRSRRPPHQRL